MRLLFAMVAAVYALLVCQSALAADQDTRLKPFNTDGCSLWIDGPPGDPNLWRHCCVAHDHDYWLGGTQEQRQASDKRLLSCVSDLGGKGMGGYMYLMVGFGGSPIWLTPYRWGYGWEYIDNGQPRGYKVPNAAEQKQIDLLLPDAEKTVLDDAVKHPSKAQSLLITQPEKAQH